ncbi:hypothetical protein BKA69DRAFT_1036087 [Paraphysoderma sedebokerense]|nr:hypothetical protein BKA69DRAFT_1036087 [Paraphysoderma sedebokerense]
MGTTLYRFHVFFKPTFEGTEEIRISFQTGSAANVENSVIDVSLFQIENGKFGKKYNIIGNIAVIGGFNRPVASGHEYTITFTPPTFLSAGEYLISSILITPQLGSQKAIIHDVTEVKFMYQAGRSTQSIIGEQTSAPTPDSEPKMAGGQSESIIDNRPFMKKVLNSLKSPAEVCRFCSSSKSLNSACDDIFQIPYPTDLIPEDTKLPENAKLLTTKRLCSIANIEDRTLRLAFKYWDKSHYVLETAIRHPMPNLIPGNSANPEFSIWTHPLLEIEYNHFVASFLNGVTQYFMHKYNPALEPGASVRDVAIPDGKLVPWDVLKIEL